LHESRNDRFAESPTRLDEHLAQGSGPGVGRKEHAGHVGRHLSLHDYAHRHVRPVDPVLLKIGTHSLRVEARPALDDRLDDFLFALDIEERLVLPGHRCFGEVFRGRRGADRDHGRVQAAIGGENRVAHIRRQFRVVPGRAVSGRRDREPARYRKPGIDQAGKVDRLSTHGRWIAAVDKGEDVGGWHIHFEFVPA